MLFLYFELIKYNHFDLLSHILVFSFNNVCNVMYVVLLSECQNQFKKFDIRK